MRTPPRAFVWTPFGQKLHHTCISARSLASICARAAKNICLHMALILDARGSEKRTPALHFPPSFFAQIKTFVTRKTRVRALSINFASCSRGGALAETKKTL